MTVCSAHSHSPPPPTMGEGEVPPHWCQAGPPDLLWPVEHSQKEQEQRSEVCLWVLTSCALVVYPEYMGHSGYSHGPGYILLIHYGAQIKHKTWNQARQPTAWSRATQQNPGTIGWPGALSDLRAGESMFAVSHWVWGDLSLANVSLCPSPLSFLLTLMHKIPKNWQPPLQRRRKGKKHDGAKSEFSWRHRGRKKDLNYSCADNFWIVILIIVATTYSVTGTVLNTL